MKYLIIEDESLAAERLQEKIQELKPDWNCLAIYGTLKELQENLAQAEADIAFVDIHLGDGSSFKALESLDIKMPLIFTTAYDQYAIRAFKLNSIDYLLKPIHIDDLKKAIQKFESQSLDNPQNLDWSQILKELKPSYKERFLVAHGEKLKTVNCADIAYFHASGKHCFLVDAEGHEYLVDQNLKDLLEQLNPEQFFQINRQYIIHLEYLDELLSYSKSRLKVIMKPALPEEGIVSAERSARFKAWLQGETKK
ncbi:LytR/AlgR family response regulator transcription factor [Croceimicrobium hydrocarbonivorans]|uniref:Response regulator transcription factor n=1 Tax=Croceimicrobium hydrocarbonivorans TaxID=2761580 RepID=A0A7H0VH44_9FLAO|nr:LytTR family DNA-binding domain-containing protein [Croceimicrobium hydrocarbonivorans]QNR25042.1 response regulator transcription factor [Croceimicrobium hydrocarbonivorans]